MKYAQFRYRVACQALKLRGRRHWMLWVAGLVLTAIITVVLIVLGQLFPNDADTSKLHPWVQTGWWKFALGCIPVITGVVGNLVANYFQARLDAAPREASTALANHHLANVVGESLRVLLTLLVDSKPPPAGMSREEFPQSVTDAAKPPLADMAAAATEFWRELVVNGPPERLAPFAGLHEPALSRFIIDPRARAMDEDTWSRFLKELDEFAKRKTGRVADPFVHDADRDVTIAMLNEQFGRSFREALKHDSTHDGLGWAAMQLQIAGQLLARASGAGDGSPEITAALADLRTVYDTGFKELSTKIDALDKASDKRHLGVMTRLSAQHSRVMGALKGLSVQVTVVQEGVDAAKQGIEAANENLRGIKKQLDGRLRSDTVPSTVPTPSPTFVPRKNITEKIHAALTAKPDEVVIRQAVTRAMGGYGKTVAAILYAEQYKDHYPGGRFMLRLETADFAQSLGELAAKLGLPVSKNPADDAPAVCDRLASATNPDGTPQPSLLILDNITSKAEWQAMLATSLVPGGHCRVLLTTRDEAIHPEDAIKIGRLTPEEARAVYAAFCTGRRDKETDDKKRAGLPDPLPTQEIADAITNWLGGLAVAVAAVAAYMKLKPHIAWQTYWQGDGKQMRGLQHTLVSELPDVKPDVAAQLGIGGAELEAHRRTLRVIDDALAALPLAERRMVEYAALLPHDLAPAIWLESLLSADAARPATSADGTPDLLHIALSADLDDTLSPAQLVLQHLDGLDILLPGGEGGKLLSLHRLWHARVNERAQTGDSSGSRLYDAVEVLVYQIETQWTGPAIASVPWSQVISLHALSERLAGAGRSTARTAARAAIRRVIPSLPSPHQAIQAQAVAVAQAVGKQLA